MTNQATLSKDSTGFADETLHPPIMGVRFGLAGKGFGQFGQINGFLEKITR